MRETPETPQTPTSSYGANTEEVMSESQAVELLNCLKVGADVFLMGERLNLDGTTDELRRDVIEIARTPAFATHWTAGLPEQHRTMATRLWRAWCTCAGSKRTQLKRLRQVFREVMLTADQRSRSLHIPK